MWILVFASPMANSKVDSSVHARYATGHLEIASVLVSVVAVVRISSSANRSNFRLVTRANTLCRNCFSAEVVFDDVHEFSDVFIAVFVILELTRTPKLVLDALLAPNAGANRRNRVACTIFSASSFFYTLLIFSRP